MKIKNGKLLMYDIDFDFFRKLCCDFKILEEKCKRYNLKN